MTSTQLPEAAQPQQLWTTAQLCLQGAGAQQLWVQAGRGPGADGGVLRALLASPRCPLPVHLPHCRPPGTGGLTWLAVNSRSDGEDEEREGSHGDLHPLSGQSGSRGGWADTVSFFADHPHGALSSLDSDHSRVGGGETTVLPWCLLKGRAVEGGVWCPVEFANICICEKEKRKGRCGEHVLGVSSLQALFYLNFTAGSRDFIPILQMRPLRLREAK